MNGIDVSSNQPANICDRVAFDFAFVKATGNPKSMRWNYYNPYMVQQVESALSKSGCAGLYHFTHGGQSAEAEADFFLSKIADYIGRVIPVIDYEDKATDNGREWLRAFIKRIKDKTNVSPMVYASSAVIKSQSLVGLCREEGCAIWSANYWLGSKRIDGYDTSRVKMDIPESTVWQYTDNGHLDGYDKGLDLDVAYISKDEWLALAKGNGATVPNVKPSTGDDLVYQLQVECNNQGFSKQNTDGIAGPVTLAGCPTLRKGAKGQITRIMQQMLINKGYPLNKYGADSSFGQETFEAVRKFQKANGLKDDGIVGKETWRKLLGL